MNALKILVQIVSIVCYFNGIEGGAKYWIKNSNILNKDNWDTNAKNCKGLIFPELTYGSMLLDNIIINEIILPVDGELYINDNAEIIFDEHDKKCITLKPQEDESMNYLDPRNWKRDPNKAVPDTHRTPCSFDDVYIPHNSTLNMMVTDLRINMKSIQYVGNNETTPMRFWQNLLIYRNCDGPEYDCQCNNNVNGDDICEFTRRFKKDVDACETPMEIDGFFCTKICGGFVRFFSRKTPKKIITFLEKQKDYVDYYITTSDNNSKQKLVFIVDKHEDNGFYSVGIAKQLYKLLKEENYDVIMQTSGKPTNTKETLLYTFEMLFGALLLTVIFFSVVFMVYVGFPQKYTSKIKWLPKTKYSFRPFTFARFENREEGGLTFDRSIAGSIVSLEKSFQNPLYGTMPSTSKEFTEFDADEIPDVGGEEMKDLDSPLLQIEDLNEEDED